MSVKERAARLLGSGIAQEVVATALGVSASYVTQLLGEEDFARQVTELRFQNLQEATARDNKYDALEDKLLEKAEELLPYMTKPREVTSALLAVNGAKRRGTKQESHVSVTQEVVVLNVPTVIQHAFITNPQNQVVQIGERDLTTITAKALLDRASKPRDQLVKRSEVEINGNSNRERVVERAGS